MPQLKEDFPGSLTRVKKKNDSVCNDFVESEIWSSYRDGVNHLFKYSKLKSFREHHNISVKGGFTRAIKKKINKCKQDEEKRNALEARQSLIQS